MSIQSSLPAATAATQFIAPRGASTHAETPAGAGPAATGGVREASTTATDAQAARDEVVSREAIDQAVDKVSDALKVVARSLQFSIDEDTGRTVVRVTDSATQEVIRQMPSKEFLEISKAVEKLQGLFIKQEA